MGIESRVLSIQLKNPKILKWEQMVRNFLERFPENSKIADVTKCEPFNRKFRKENQLERGLLVRNYTIIPFEVFLFSEKCCYFAIGNFSKFTSEFFVEWNALIILSIEN